MNASRLDELARLWRRRTVARELLAALGAGGALAALAVVLARAPSAGWLAAVAGFVTVLATRLVAARPWRIGAAQLGSHLDRTYPELEESSVLWLRPPDRLSPPERLQRRRLDVAFASLEKLHPAPAAPPRGFLRPGAWTFAVGLAALALAGGFAAWRRSAPNVSAKTGMPVAAPVLPATTPAPAAAAGMTPPRIVETELTVTPPAYTGRSERHLAGLDAVDVEEGAAVAWSVSLDRPEAARELWLVLGESERLPLVASSPSGEGSRFRGRRGTITESVLYHLAGTLPDGTTWNSPEIHALKVRPDTPPVLSILQPDAPRTVVEPPAAGGPEPPRLRVEVLASDDYGLAEAHLVATVAKGSGEAVKFREQTVVFDANEPTTTYPGARRLSKTFDLAALGLEPGDELYFYVEARDNRQPTPNRARSETRFVVLRGPDEKTASSGRGMAGVNLVPEYFRSQRQLIIDTEKLVADRPGLSDAEFRRRSNDLGIDQDLLRLRYGQFLGEESEQGAGDHVETSLNPLVSGVPADLVHQHDAPGAENRPTAANDPRAGLRTAMRLRLEHEEQARGGGGHGDDAPPSAPNTGVPPTASQIVAPYVDQHDSQDEATLFDRETKGTLRDALQAMWEAEGFLRTAHPAEALPAENRALVILKDLQQSARAYVQRVGFEPAPLKIAERRLRGDATGAPPRFVVPETKSTADEGTLAPVRAALGARPTGGATDRELLRRAEPALTAAATLRPEIFLEGLGALRRTLAGGTSVEDVAAVRRALWQLLPPAEARPGIGSEAAPALAESYFRALRVSSPGEESRP